MLKTDARHKIQERQHTLQVKGRVKRKKPKKPFAQAAKEPKEKILGQTICMLLVEKRRVVVVAGGHMNWLFEPWFGEQSFFSAPLMRSWAAAA